MIDLKVVFSSYNDDHMKFSLVENKLHPRPDLCAFLLLDKLLPNDGNDMISAAEHDEIYLDINCDELADVATEDDILTLIRCGVRYDDDMDALVMWV